MAGGPLIQKLRVMGNKDKLPVMVFNRPLCRQEPRLYFPQSDEVIRLVDKNSVSSSYEEVKDHIQGKQAALTFGKFGECIIHVSLLPGTGKIGPRASLSHTRWGKI